MRGSKPGEGRRWESAWAEGGEPGPGEVREPSLGHTQQGEEQRPARGAVHPRSPSALCSKPPSWSSRDKVPLWVGGSREAGAAARGGKLALRPSKGRAFKHRSARKFLGEPPCPAAAGGKTGPVLAARSPHAQDWQPESSGGTSRSQVWLVSGGNGLGRAHALLSQELTEAPPSWRPPGWSTRRGRGGVWCILKRKKHRHIKNVHVAKAVMRGQEPGDEEKETPTHLLKSRYFSSNVMRRPGGS